MKQIILKTVLQNGLYAGGILSAYFLILYLVNLNFMQMSFVTALIQASVTIIFMFMGISQVRKMNEDKKINFLHAFLIAGCVMFLALFCFSLIKLAILFFVDVEYLEKSVNEVYLQTLQVLKDYPQYADKTGNPEDIKKLLLFGSHLQIYLTYLVESLVAGALVALIARKKDRIEDSLNA